MNFWGPSISKISVKTLIYTNSDSIANNDKPTQTV